MCYRILNLRFETIPHEHVTGLTTYVGKLTLKTCHRINHLRFDSTTHAQHVTELTMYGK